MINRRIVRGKVMQQLYAYSICTEANLLLAKDQISAYFKPNLNSLEPQDAQKLEGLEKLTLLHLGDYTRTLEKNNTEDLPSEVYVCFNKALEALEKANTSDKNHIQKILIQECENIYNHYLQILAILPDIGNILLNIKKIQNLKSNIFVQGLENNPILQQEIVKQNITWYDNQNITSDIINQLLKDEVYKLYTLAQSDSVDQEREFALYFLRNIVLKNEQLLEYFNELDYNWDENKPAIKDMACDTIKNMSPNGEVLLSTLSKNWEDDKDFLKILYNKCIENDRISENLIKPTLKNWDIDRLTTTDAIIMKMCITEMIEFSSIPTKVSINEYLDLSKRFSTPKSKLIINGVIETISVELVKNGTIKKSGRGLMDNK